MTYLRRHIDQRLDHLLSVHPACLIEGIRGVGKTTTAMRRAASALRLDHPPTAAQMAADPDAVCAALPEPLLIDEWHRVPEVWDAVRRMIDIDRRAGRFLLSGSSRNAVRADIHAGAGRMIALRLRPMTLSERRGRTPLVPLGDVAQHGIEAVRGARSPFSPSEQTAPTTLSGLPGYLELDAADHQEALRSYLDLAISRDLAEISSTARHASKLRNYVRAYAAAVGTTADHSTIYRAADLAKATGQSYHDLLDRVGLVEELPGWSSNRFKRLTKRPKRHLVDPAFASADHYETAETLRAMPARLGVFFESVVVSQIRATADAAGLGWRFGHLRTAGGEHEIDLMVDLPDRGVLAFEAKLGSTVTTSDTRHLAALRDRLGERFRAGLVIHPGGVAVRLDRRIAAVPLGVLV